MDKNPFFWNSEKLRLEKSWTQTKNIDWNENATAVKKNKREETREVPLDWKCSYGLRGWPARAIKSYRKKFEK